MAVILVEEPTYRFLVVAFCGLVMFGGCVCLVFVPKIIAVYFYDPVNLNLFADTYIFEYIQADTHIHTHTHMHTHTRMFANIWVISHNFYIENIDKHVLVHIFFCVYVFM